MALSRIKKGDTVKIIAGKDKGTIAVVNKMVGNNMALLAGVGERKRFHAATQIAPAGKRDIQVPVNLSNVALVIDEKTNKTSRVGTTVNAAGEKIRVALQNNKKEIK